MNKYYDYIIIGEGSSGAVFASRLSEYPNNKILVIGDSFADLNAAKDNKVLFYPIIPSKEKESWNFFLNRGIKDFFNLDYKEKIEKIKINEFKAIFSGKLFNQ